ncbi:helix-turn-helix domain-containing protein [Rhodovastum sp. RN2-1]|uniref:Helix-turn-helix domain-containing protein n=1 Tax=Limobrevibacterium gyesilva TaxID=2991712 RepID=A0AA41YWI5_9PROT|nr:helix-turn-helix domain-containing protein [Limobrevibacterium gyesilva]
MKPHAPAADSQSDPRAGAGARIRAARQARGMTQEALARAVGVTRSAVAQWETDRSGQVGGNLARVAHALGVAAEYLLTGALPAGGGPAAADGTELALLRLYRACSDEDRSFLLRTAARLARQAEQEAGGVPGSGAR